MRILIVTQYFWPESFRINDLALGLKERGNKVTILTGKPNYPSGKFHSGYSFFRKNKESWNGMTVYRAPLIPRGRGNGLRLLVNYLSFAFFATLKARCLKEQFDLIFVFEPSPITVGIPAVLLSKKRGIPLYFWVQDLWPESITAAGKFHNKFVIKQIERLTQWIYDNSTKVLIQSEGFRTYIINQGVTSEKIIYFPNTTENLYKPVIPREAILNKVPNVPFKVMFAGNIGESQDFETIIDAAKIINTKNKDIHFIILGDGRKKEYVLERIKSLDLDRNFHLLGAYPVKDMPDFFACADALLVTLKKDPIFALTIPSKVQSYLACAKPILAAINGEGAKIIAESKSGLTASAGDPYQLAENILTMYNMGPQKRAEMSSSARYYFELNFERNMLLDKLIGIFKGIK